LAAEDGTVINYEAYALELLQLASISEQQIRQLLIKSWPEEAKKFHHNPLVAAAFTNHVFTCNDFG